jgi:PIN domain nuclease of toxin-antitoxin system
MKLMKNGLALPACGRWQLRAIVGKLKFPLPVCAFVEQQMTLNSMELLTLNMAHLEIIESLPLHHRDPFDRLLIAQSMTEDFLLVGTDEVFDFYDIDRLW